MGNFNEFIRNYRMRVMLMLDAKGTRYDFLCIKGMGLKLGIPSLSNYNDPLDASIEWPFWAPQDINALVQRNPAFPSRSGICGSFKGKCFKPFYPR
jgi:hypothetical protein